MCQKWKIEYCLELQKYLLIYFYSVEETYEGG
jgi:hypothetical protein